jgi:hypothetical protein
MPFDWTLLRDSSLKWELVAAEKQLLALGDNPNTEGLLIARTLVLALIEKAQAFSVALLKSGCPEEAIQHMRAVEHVCGIGHNLADAVGVLAVRKTVGYTPALN